MRKVYFLLFCALFVTGNAVPVSAQKKTSAKQVRKSAQDAPILNAVAAPSNLSFEREILAEINLARQNPLGYVKYLEEWRKNYNGRQLRLANRPVIITSEGTDVVDEAIAYLKSLKPLSSVSASKGLYLAAFDHLQDMKKSGKPDIRAATAVTPMPELSVTAHGATESRKSSNTARKQPAKSSSPQFSTTECLIARTVKTFSTGNSSSPESCSAMAENTRKPA